MAEKPVWSAGVAVLSGASSLRDDLFSEFFMPYPDSGEDREFMESLFCKPLAKNKCISWCWFYWFLGLPDILVVIPEFSKLKMAFVHFNLKFVLYNNRTFFSARIRDMVTRVSTTKHWQLVVQMMTCPERGRGAERCGQKEPIHSNHLPSLCSLKKFSSSRLRSSILLLGVLGT